MRVSQFVSFFGQLFDRNKSDVIKYSECRCILLRIVGNIKDYNIAIRKGILNRVDSKNRLPEPFFSIKI